MHVAFWSPAWPVERHPNGIVTYVSEVRREIAKRGHRVSVFTAHLDESVADEHVFWAGLSKWDRFVNLVARRSAQETIRDFSSAISRAVLREHRRNPIDIIEMEESFGWCADVQSATSLPMTVKLHGPAFLTAVDRERNAPFVRERIEREGRALARCASIVSPSEANLKRTAEYYGLTSKLMRVIANPVTPDERAPIWRLSACDPKTIVFVGRFDLVKGADIVLRAFSSVLKEFPDAKLVFAGPDNGWLSEDGARVQFSSYCDSVLQANERSRVDFRGLVPHTEVAALRASSMMTIVASRWESQPYALLEAMAQGCPIVSTDAGACPESIFHERTGFLARSGDSEDFAAKICAVLRDPLAASAMGRAAREHVLKHHSASVVVDAMLENYELAISNHQRQMNSGK